MTVSIDREAFEEIVETMRQLKGFVDTKMEDREKGDDQYQRKLCDLSCQMELANGKLNNMQMTQASEKRKQQSEVSMLRKQLEILQNENQFLKGQREDPAMDPYSAMKLQITQLQRTNEQLVQQLKNSGNLFKIQRKEMDAVMQMQRAWNNTKRDHEQWLAQSYRTMETGYNKLQSKYGPEDSGPCFYKFEQLVAEKSGDASEKKSSGEAEGEGEEKSTAEADDSAGKQSTDSEKLLQENHSLRSELRKSLDLVEKQARLIQKEKKSFFDEHDSSMSVDHSHHDMHEDSDKPADTSPETDANAAVEETVQAAAKAEIPESPSPGVLQEETRKSSAAPSGAQARPFDVKKLSAPEMILTAPSEEQAGSDSAAGNKESTGGSAKEEQEKRFSNVAERRASDKSGVSLLDVPKKPGQPQKKKSNQ